MIPAEKKVSFTEIPAGLANQLSQTFSTADEKSTTDQNSSEKAQLKTESSAPVSNVSKIQTVTNETEKSEAAKSASKKNDRPGQINICLPPEIKTEWKLLFTKNNVNITQGIIFAVEHLKNEIESGQAILTVGGVISKK